MQRMVRWLAALIAASVLVTACSSDDPIESASAEPPVIGDEPTPVPTEVPAAVPATGADEPESVVLDDEDRVDAALAAFDAERGADYLAYDVLGSQVAGDNVSLDLCAWTGETVYDEVLDVIVSVTAERTSVISVAQGEGDCLNTELIDSAFTFIDEHDEYWTAITGDPTTFDPAVRAPEIFTPGNLQGVTELVAGWVDQAVHWEGLAYDGDPVNTTVQPLLWRRYQGVNLPVLAVLACRDMNPSNGLYQDELLLDDGKQGDPRGNHALLEYLLVRQDSTWRVSGVESTVWADCFFSDDWLSGMNDFDADPVPWREYSR